YSPGWERFGGGGAGGAVSITSGSSVSLLGYITSTGYGTGGGGSVGIAAAGGISVNGINTYGSSYAGNIFVSSGSSAYGQGQQAVIVGKLDTSGTIFLGAAK